MRIRPVRIAGVATQATFSYVALSRLARGRERRGPLAAAAAPAPGQAPRISVVVPARDEAARLAGVLAPLRAAPGVMEVIVVDDRSTDATAAIARQHGAVVVEGSALPEGWIGKPWALQQGLVAARGDVVVFLDADVRPDPALPAAVAGLLETCDLASAQLAFSCPDLAQRMLHPALLATLIYRLGPLDTTQRVPSWDAAINGQCFAARRTELLGAGGFGLVAGISTDDIALARALSSAGWRIAVADGSALGSVRMYESAGEAMREWAGRSLALPGASSRTRMLFDLGMVWSVQGRPALRLWRVLWRAAWATRRVRRERRSAAAIAAAALAVAPRWRGGGGASGRGGPSEAGLGPEPGSLAAEVARHALIALRPTDYPALALRLALQLALLRTYRRGGRAAGREGRGYPDVVSLVAPLLDPVAVAALTRGTIAPVREWRGRRM